MCRLSQEAKANYKWFKEEISRLLFLKFKSAYHAQRWSDFDRILVYRTIVYMIGRVF